MKKLSITKEAFEKSKYFTNKYGKLEYVSESGKLFKTEKGKILKFKESKQMNEGVFGDIGDSIDDGIRGIKKFFHKAKFKKGDKIMVCMGDFTPPGVQHGLEVIDTKYGGWSGGWEYRTGTDDWGNPEWWPELRVALDTNPDGGYEKYDPEKFPEFKKMEKYIKKPSKESTKKFGKKFKESVGDISTDPAYVCPYCGGRNCVFDDADDSPLEGYFDGGTLNAQFYCDDCNKFYNVDYELKVKDVYPNEDADELSSDWDD